MRYVCLVLAILAVSASAQKPRKAPDVQVLEVKSHRNENTLTLDGKVKITGVKPLKALILEFAFLSASGDVLTTQKTEVSDEPLQKDDEQAFHVETNNPPGSIQFKMNAYDKGDRALSVGNGGPFTIE
jgi:hypothetical protein